MLRSFSSLKVAVLSWSHTQRFFLFTFFFWRRGALSSQFKKKNENEAKDEWKKKLFGLHSYHRILWAGWFLEEFVFVCLVARRSQNIKLGKDNKTTSSLRTQKMLSHYQKNTWIIGEDWTIQVCIERKRGAKWVSDSTLARHGRACFSRNKMLVQVQFFSGLTRPETFHEEHFAPKRSQNPAFLIPRSFRQLDRFALN